MSICKYLAESILSSKVDLSDKSLVEATNSAILDTVGVTLAGSVSGATNAVLKALFPSEQLNGALTLGTKLRLNPLDAALLNGTSSHALDFDDCNNTMGGHPTVPIFGGLFANGEVNGVSGEEIITAYAIGVETICAMAKVVNFHHYEKGWHPTTTLGIFGAVAANARLQKLDVDTTATALAIATSMASGIKANFGTFTKPYHVGQCTRNGLLAVRLAENGLTASHNALDGEQGFFMVYNGQGNFDATKIFEGWGSPFEIIDPGIAVKVHPCCGSTHPAVDAAIALKNEFSLELKDIKSVLSLTHPRRLKHTNRPQVSRGFDGKFSVQYVVAKALQNGKITLQDFSDEKVNEPEIKKFLQEKIRAKPHPDAEGFGKNVYFAEIVIETEDGQILQKFVDAPVGRDKNHPLPKNTLVNKFYDCCSDIIQEDCIEELVNKIMNLQDITDIRKLTGMIENATVK